MRLPGGRPPRMDLYGHNPFTSRPPALWRPYVGSGYADFSDLDTLAGWVDRNLGRRGGRRIKLFISEFTVPTDHANHVFPFHVSRRTQAAWLGAALRITRRWPRIYTFGWLGLYDEAPNGPGGRRGDETNCGPARLARPAQAGLRGLQAGLARDGGSQPAGHLLPRLAPKRRQVSNR